jgi:hypothetical protein
LPYQKLEGVNICLAPLKTFVRGGIIFAYYVKFHLCNESDSFKWALIVVYGPTQDDQKEKFLAELVNMCSLENLTILMGGDFNILRHSAEKKTMIDSIIDDLSFLTLSLMG